MSSLGIFLLDWGHGWVFLSRLLPEISTAVFTIAACHGLGSAGLETIILVGIIVSLSVITSCADGTLRVSEASGAFVVECAGFTEEGAGCLIAAPLDRPTGVLVA